MSEFSADTAYLMRSFGGAMMGWGLGGLFSWLFLLPFLFRKDLEDFEEMEEPIVFFRTKMTAFLFALFALGCVIAFLPFAFPIISNFGYRAIDPSDRLGGGHEYPLELGGHFLVEGVLFGEEDEK